MCRSDGGWGTTGNGIVLVLESEAIRERNMWQPEAGTCALVCSWIDEDDAVSRRSTFEGCLWSLRIGKIKLPSQAREGGCTPEGVMQEHRWSWSKNVLLRSSIYMRRERDNLGRGYVLLRWRLRHNLRLSRLGPCRWSHQEEKVAVTSGASMLLARWRLRGIQPQPCWRLYSILEAQQVR